jgi:hypothetical protein
LKPKKQHTMKTIQMVDLKGQYEKIKEEVNRGIQEVIDSTSFIKGGKVVDFQKQLESYLGERMPCKFH